MSPLKRTLDTLKPLLARIENPQVITSDLTSERNLGDFTGTAMGVFQEWMI